MSAPTQYALDGAPGFAEFYAAYPRRTARGAAVKAWERAVKVAAPLTIIEAARAYTATNPDPQYVPHPATWLNQMRWEDEPQPEPKPPVDMRPEYPDWVPGDPPAIDAETQRAMLAEARRLLKEATTQRSRP